MLASCLAIGADPCGRNAQIERNTVSRTSNIAAASAFDNERLLRRPRNLSLTIS